MPTEFLLKNQLIALWEFPCMLFVVFPLLLFIFFLSFLSCELQCVLVCSSLGSSCMGLCTFWTWVTVSFLRVGKFSAIMFLNMRSAPFSLFWDSYNVNISGRLGYLLSCCVVKPYLVWMLLTWLAGFGHEVTDCRTPGNPGDSTGSLVGGFSVQKTLGLILPTPSTGG